MLKYNQTTLSQNQLIDSGFPYWEYESLTFTGYCLAQLQLKVWGENMNLIAYFDCLDGLNQKASFSIFRDKDAKYQPKKGHHDLAESTLGQFFILKVAQNEKGYSYIEEIWQVDSEKDVENMMGMLLEELKSSKHLI